MLRINFPDKVPAQNQGARSARTAVETLMTDYTGFSLAPPATCRSRPSAAWAWCWRRGRDIISFAPGYPAPETFPWKEFRDITNELLSGADGAVLQYGPTRGYRPLLETIAGIMEHRGARTSLRAALVTTGSQQGLDLVARVLLDPGDIVLVELPTYTGAITAFRNVQARMVGVQTGSRRHRPRPS